VESGEGELAILGYREEMLNKVPEGTMLTVAQDITSTKVFRVMSNIVVKLKFKELPKTATPDLELSQLFVAPNPFNELLRIANVNIPNASYELINATGIVVRSGMFENGEIILSTASLEVGVYLLRL
jgi:hypothetical protein